MPNHDGLFHTVIYVAEVKQKTSTGDTYKRNENVTYPAGKRIVINAETGAKEKTRISAADMLFAIDVQYSQNGRLHFIDNVKPINSNIKQIPIPGESVLIFQSFNHESTPEESYTQWYYLFPMALSSNTNSNSTIDFKDDYSESGNWRGSRNGDPILVLSNGRQYKENKKFVTEDINTDKSSLYLTSTQKLPLVLGSKTQPN